MIAEGGWFVRYRHHYQNGNGRQRRGSVHKSHTDKPSATQYISKEPGFHQ